MTEQEIAARRAALTAILVRNRILLQWYIDQMLERMPQLYINMLFKVFAMVDKEKTITRDTMWGLVPAFFAQLTNEQFGIFLTHIKDIADIVEHEYEQFITTEQTQSLPISRTTHDDHRTERIREDNTGTLHLDTSNSDVVSSSNPGH